MSTIPTYCFNQPLLNLKDEKIEHRFPLGEDEEPKKGARVETESPNGREFKVQYMTLMLSSVVGDALDRFIQEPPKPVGQVDYRELSISLNKLLSSKKPKVKREDLKEVSTAVNKLQTAQRNINEATHAQLSSKDLLMLARLTQNIYLSEGDVELTQEQIDFIVKAVNKTNNGMIIMRVHDLLGVK